MLNHDFNKAYETAVSLEATVIRDAEAKAKRITEEIKARKIEVIKEKKLEAEQCAAHFEMTEKKRIDAEIKNRIDDKKTQATRELLKKRADIQKKVFDSVYSRVLEFAKTEEYRVFIDTLAKRVKECGVSDDITVFVSKNPIDSEAAMRHFGKAEVDYDIQLGGIKVRDNARSVLFDLTLDYRFEAEKGEFLNISALKIGE